MRVLIMKVSDDDYEEIREFSDWNELIEYLRSSYSTWIIEFDKERIIYNRFHSDGVDVEVLMYDDYVG